MCGLWKDLGCKNLFFLGNGWLPMLKDNPQIMVIFRFRIQVWVE